VKKKDESYFVQQYLQAKETGNKTMMKIYADILNKLNIKVPK